MHHMASGGSNVYPNRGSYSGSRSFRSHQSFDDYEPTTTNHVPVDMNETVVYRQSYNDPNYNKRYDQSYDRGYDRRYDRRYDRVPEVYDQGQENLVHKSGSFRGQFKNHRIQAHGKGQQGRKFTDEQNSASSEVGFQGDASCDADSVGTQSDKGQELKARKFMPVGNCRKQRNEHQETFRDRNYRWHHDNDGYAKQGNRYRQPSDISDRSDQFYTGSEKQGLQNDHDSSHLDVNWRRNGLRNSDDKDSEVDSKPLNHNECNTGEFEKRISEKSDGYCLKEKQKIFSENCTDRNKNTRFKAKSLRYTDDETRSCHQGQNNSRQNKLQNGSRYLEKAPRNNTVEHEILPGDELEHCSRDLNSSADQHSGAGDKETSVERADSIASSVESRGFGARKKSSNWRNDDQGGKLDNSKTLGGEVKSKGSRRVRRNRKGALEIGNDKHKGETRNSIDPENGRQDVESRKDLWARECQAEHGEENGEAGNIKDSATRSQREEEKRAASNRNAAKAFTKDSNRKTRGRWDGARHSTDYNNRGGNESWKRIEQDASWQRTNGSEVRHNWHDHPGQSSSADNKRSMDLIDHSVKEEHERLRDVSMKECSNQEIAKLKNTEMDLSKEGEIQSSRIWEARQPKRRTRDDDNFPRTAMWQDETQRGLLIDQLCAGKYECLVCFNLIRSDSAAWSCSSCYHIYHLYCIKKWAQSSAATPLPDGTGTAWRCPTCQNSYLQVPNQYTCFCSKQRDPEFNRYATPHSCNETCSRERSRGCPHRCTLLCHPGPCPPCSAFVVRSCDCGKTKRSIKCAGDATSFKCTEPCGRTLNCGQHVCAELCHAGSCGACNVELERRCYCSQEVRTVHCGSGESFLVGFSCGETCGRRLACGRHDCVDKCHPGPCVDCPRRPDAVMHCACGKTLLKEIPGSRRRKTCEDPIATCEKVCDKELACGNAGSRHRCQQRCHEGLCPTTCDRMTDVTCRCGAVTKEISCMESLQFGESMPFVCERRCKKKMSCGRHRCNQTCCTSEEHQCHLICGYKLSCGMHRCEEPCHKGNCPPCWQVSFDELRCYCGAQVIYPPIPCGTKPPECNRPCTRQHTCNHPATHHCHSEEFCPPCTVLTEKWCLGRHELRRNIPCYVTEISCGMQCGKELPCLVHKCQQCCHKGPCLDGKVCTQPCPMIRNECGHPCQAPCHPGTPCPATVCKAEVTLQCDCGRRKEKGQCHVGHDSGGQSDYSKMTAQFVASKLWEGQSIDLAVLCKELGSKKARKLQCNSECSIMERNQRLALALEIKNPDLSSKLGNPPYSQFLKDFAKQNLTFVAGVEKALSDLVTAAQQPKVARKLHSFKVMPSNQRRIVHELAEFYGCQTESYDEEPNKNVVATAIKDKCWLPSVTLTALVQRELFPKAPVPIPINCKEDKIRSAAQAAKQSTQVFALPSASSSSTKATGNGQASGSSAASSNRRNNEPKIDYFDYTG